MNKTAHQRLLVQLSAIALTAVLAVGIYVVRNSGTVDWPVDPLTGAAAQQTAGDIPSGAVMLFDLAACPSGWSELTQARGRYIVGMAPSGTLKGTQGTALADLENRAVGEHAHTVSDAGHGHSITDPTHGHAATVVDPGHTHTSNSHRHSAGNFVAETDCDHEQYSFIDDAGCAGEEFRYISKDTTDATVSIQSSGTNVSVNLGASSTGITVDTATTGISVNSAGGVAGTNAPYVQLLVCRKN